LVISKQGGIELFKIEELEVYQMAMDIGERVWNIVIKWNFFAKDTVGKQLVKAADSVAANLSEGYGRFFYKENKQFCYYSRGSIYETLTFLKKAHSRNLITDSEFSQLKQDIELISKKLNAYINSIGKHIEDSGVSSYLTSIDQ
jgi:four helix bundle protein